MRVYEHLGKSYRTDEPLGVPLNSDIRDHCHTMDHAMNRNNFAIIDKWRYKHDLPILESLHKKIKKPTIGTHTQSTPLLAFD